MTGNSISSSQGGKKRFRLGVQWKVTLIVMAVVVVFMAFILGYLLPQMQSSLYEAKKVETQDQVQTVCSILQYYYMFEECGAMTREDAQKDAKTAIASLRYGPENMNYFFVIDYRPYMIVHPFNTRLVDTDVSQYKDANGDLMFQKMVALARSQKEGFTSYMWQYKNEANRIVPKTSYIKSFEPWGWIVGTDIYTVDVEETIGAVRTQILIISLVIMLVSVLFCIWLVRIMISRPLKSLVGVGKAVAVGDVEQDVVVKSDDEVGEATRAFADVVAYMKDLAAASEKLAGGDLNVEIAPKSDKDALSHAFGSVVANLKDLISNMQKVYLEQMAGDIDYYMAADKYRGAFKEVAEGFNAAIRMHVDNILKILGILSSYADGDFKPVLEKLPGKQAVANEKMDMLRNNLMAIIQELDELTMAAAEGRLDVRGDAGRFKGDYLRIINGFNKTLDSIVVPLNEAGAVLAREVNYDLTTHVAGNYQGELEKLKDAINSSLDNRIAVVVKLKQVTRELQESSKQLIMASEQAGQATQQIAASSQQVAKGAADQAGALQETMKAMENLSRAIDQIARGAQEQAQMIEKNVQLVSQVSSAINDISAGAQKAAAGARVASESAQTGAAMARETVRGMENIKKTMDAASGKVNGLGERSREIGKIVSAIDDIADQTNLLALNAAVEAARAGEQGRGFAVVADEVRKLAERSQEATKEIADLIGGIQNGVAETIRAMENGNKEVDAGYELANKAGEALEQILNHARDVGVQVEQISSAVEELTAMSTEMVKLSDNISAIVEQNTAATEEMAATAKQVSKAVESVAGVAEENSAAAEQVSAAAEEISAQVEEVVASGATLAQMGDEFDKLVSKYKLADDGKAGGNGHGNGSESESRIELSGQPAPLKVKVSKN